MFFEALGRSRPPRSRRPGLGKSPFPGRGTAAAVALHTCPGNRRPCARRSNDRRDVPRACRNHLAGQVMSQALREVSTPRRYPPGFWRKALDLIEVGRRPHRRRERPCRRLPCRFLHIPRPPVTESGLRSRQPSGAGEVVEHAVIETRRRGRSHLPLRAPTRRGAGPVGAPQGPRAGPVGGAGPARWRAPVTGQGPGVLRLSAPWRPYDRLSSDGRVAGPRVGACDPDGRRPRPVPCRCTGRRRCKGRCAGAPRPGGAALPPCSLRPADGGTASGPCPGAPSSSAAAGLQGGAGSSLIFDLGGRTTPRT
jgi:hypothetical protein